MSTTDEVIGSIDHALRDFDTSPDAMRWTPEIAPPDRTVKVSFRIDTSAFTAAMATLQAAMATIGRTFAKVVADLGDAFYVPPHSNRSDKLRQLHTAYRARSRRRTRRNR